MRGMQNGENGQRYDVVGGGLAYIYIYIYIIHIYIYIWTFMYILYIYIFLTVGLSQRLDRVDGISKSRFTETDTNRD